MTVSLSDLRTLARQYADMPSRPDGGGFVTDTELTGLINRGGARLHSLLVSTFEDYARTSGTFTISSGSTYTLPTDFFKLRGVDRQNGSDWIPIRPVTFAERGSYIQSRTGLWVDSVSNHRYELANTTLTIYPTDDATGTYQIHYVPRWTDLEFDADQLPDFMTVENWHEYIPLWAAIRMLRKEESDVSLLAGDLADLERSIQQSAADRDAGDTKHVAEVRDREDDDRRWLR